MSQQQLNTVEFLEAMAAKEAIREALLRYCRGIDRRDFDLMRSAYHPDAYDHHGGYNGGVDGLITWAAQRAEAIEQALHVLANVDIRLSGSTASVETYCLVYQRLAGEPAPGTQTVARARFLDRFECRRGEWRIAHRRVIHESTAIEEPGAPFGPGFTVARRDREDASYEILT